MNGKKVPDPELEVGTPGASIPNYVPSDVDVCTLDSLFPNCPALKTENPMYAVPAVAVQIPTSTSSTGAVDKVLTKFSSGHVASLNQ